KLEYVFKTIVESIDLNLTKERTNAIATADIVVGDEIWAEAVPVNAILTAETRVKRLRQLILAIPTLAPKESWELTDNNDQAIYKTKPKTRIKTKKVQNFETVAAATEHHPAQVREVSSDVKAGVWETTLLSGEIQPSTKSKMLARVDKLSGILQNAREKANTIEVEELKIGNKIRTFIMDTLNEDLKSK
ncbi:hypothetical protein LCGC14_2884310, partial [marine sediment metagenome]